MENNIILLGFMGCGKSTIGKILAKTLNLKFCDCDTLAEQRENTSVNEIFATKGEAYFRNLETEILKDVCSKKGQIIATGGGAVLKQENVDILRQNGLVIYLDVESDTVLERLKNDTTRPLLARKDKRSAIDQLLSFRKPLYEKAAHVTISADSEAEIVAKSICEIYLSQASKS